MPTAQELYPLLVRLFHAGQLVAHATACQSIAQHVATLLCAQSLRASRRARALPSPASVPARQRFKRLARALDRTCLAPATLSPLLVRAGLCLVSAAGVGPACSQPWRLALDSVRCGPWEVFVLGVTVRGRTLPIGWAVLPYPWPKGRFTPTVCALIAQVGTWWPRPQPAVLLADRAFPSKAFFSTLRRVGWGWTVRLHGRHPVACADGRRGRVRELLTGRPSGRWQAWAVTFGSGPAAIMGTLMRGPGLPVLPRHQVGPASLRARARQADRRAQHAASKHPGQTTVSHDAWVVLFTTEIDPLTADRQYRARWSIEGTFRDAQGGWDGTQGWGLEATLTRTRTATHVEALVGLWALGALVHTWVGLRLDRDAVGQRGLRRWATTPRVSVWARGKFALEDPDPTLQAWIRATLRDASAILEDAPAPIIPVIPSPATPRSPEQAA